MAGLLRTRCAALAHQITGFVLDSQWHALLGLALVVAAKMLGTTVVAWLSSPTHPPYADAPALVCQPLPALEALERPDHRAIEG